MPSTGAMSKSPKLVAIEALKAAQRALPPFSATHSPKKFTQHQHFAIAVLRQFFKVDYRGIAAILEDAAELHATLEIQEALENALAVRALPLGFQSERLEERPQVRGHGRREGVHQKGGRRATAPARAMQEATLKAGENVPIYAPTRNARIRHLGSRSAAS